MRGFQYALQKVLDLKTNEKKQAEWILSEAVGDLMTKESQLQQCTADLLHAREEPAASGGCSRIRIQPSGLAAIYRLYGIAGRSGERAGQRRGSQRSEQAGRAGRTDDRRKSVDEGQEKAEAQFNQQVAAWEQNELDELATVRYHMAAR